MINPDDQAFPNVENGYAGMNLRTYIATQVLSNVMASPTTVASLSDLPASTICAAAIKWADALIAELNKKP